MAYDGHRYAVVTLVTSDSYLPGALVALNSLLDAEGVSPSPTARNFATLCLATPATLGHASLQALDKAFDQVIGVEPILTKSWEELRLLGRQDLAASLTKLHVFRLTQFEKVLYLDADTLVLRPLSHLFELPYRFAAAPDVGWPDAFNSGVFLAQPSTETFDGLREMMRQRGTWDGGDQGLLNDYFHDWHRLSFTYNVTPTAYYTYAPAYKRHGQNASVLHFIGAEKPWHRGTRDAYVPNAAEKDYYGLVQQWFDVFVRHYGGIATYDVANRVVAPPSYVRRAPTSLPKLVDLPPAATQSGSSVPAPTTPTLVLSPPSPLRAPSASTSSALPPPIPIVGAGPAKRAPSLPQLTWDASRSSPPRDGPPQMREDIPYSTNVWDLASKRAQKERFEPPTSYAPPPVETHDWYRDILRQKPDPSKVKAVFPWEQSATTPSTPAAAPDRPPPPPTRTFSEESAGSAAPGSFARTGIGAFTNAWDAVPGIQRYAQSLVKTGRSRKNSHPGAAPTGGSGTSSGGNGSSSASGGNHTSSRGQGNDKNRHHRRKSSAGSASGAASAALGFCSAGSPHAVTSPRVSSSASRQQSGVFTKEGDASSRDGDDEEDEDADISTATDGDEAPETDETKTSNATSSERDSDEGIDKIAIKFRRTASHPEWAREIHREGGGNGSTDESDDAATLRSAPTSPGKTRRPEPRFVPTSPRQPRSPHLSTSPHLTLPSTLTRPSLHVLASSSGSSTAGPRSPISPRLAAQAIRNSTAARLIASGSGSGDAPPVVRATRVFRPETDTSNVKQQGLAALQRFVENMEASVSSQQATQSSSGGESRH
ncbi:hypothetical protein JCM10908_001056 [Rhodotorula pacifica]|uniref:uncharacterized protein n=1 Tax=Rhodotorula pacifica TaxID=1495444 RepID=UPI003173EE8C